MEDFITNVITSAGVAGLLVLLFREWISTRLKCSIQHEYDQKLEAHKARLKAENEVALLELKTTFEREATLHAAAHASFSEGQKASMERKLNASDRLWQEILHLRNSSRPLAIIDSQTVVRYKNNKNKPLFHELVVEPSKASLKDMMDSKKDDQTEDVRLYVGGDIWTIFVAYKSIMLKRLLLFHFEDDDAAKIEWYKNADVRQLIEAILTAEELRAFDQTIDGKGSWLQGLLESKILTSLQKIISGEEFGVKSLEQARLIQHYAENLNLKRKYDKTVL